MLKVKGKEDKEERWGVDNKMYLIGSYTLIEFCKKMFLNTLNIFYIEPFLNTSEKEKRFAMIIDGVMSLWLFGLVDSWKKPWSL